ncbi:unnamed protein product, partial [Didymodactylos carnosus]
NCGDGGYPRHVDEMSSSKHRYTHQNFRYRGRNSSYGTDVRYRPDGLMNGNRQNFQTNGSQQYRGHMRVFNNSRGRPRPNGQSYPHKYQSQQQQQQHYLTKWWKISIPGAGQVGKDRVLSTLKVHLPRPFQHYNYFIERDTNKGIFFVNSKEEADMLKRASGKILIQNSET